MENFDAKKFAINLKWKMGVLQILNVLPFLALTLSTLWMDEMGLGRILLALVLFFTFRTIIILVYNKKLYALLHDDLAPGRLLDVLREGKIYSRNGGIELHAYLAAGLWQRVADICAQKLNDPQYRLKKHVYMGFLADMYFNLADDAHLREVCDAYDAYVAASKPDAIMQQMNEPMAYYRNYLDGAYESPTAMPRPSAILSMRWFASVQDTWTKRGCCLSALSRMRRSWRWPLCRRNTCARYGRVASLHLANASLPAVRMACRPFRKLTACCAV